MGPRLSFNFRGLLPLWPYLMKEDLFLLCYCTHCTVNLGPHTVDPLQRRLSGLKTNMFMVCAWAICCALLCHLYHCESATVWNKQASWCVPCLNFQWWNTSPSIRNIGRGKKKSVLLLCVKIFCVHLFIYLFLLKSLSVLSQSICCL